MARSSRSPHLLLFALLVALWLLCIGPLPCAHASTCNPVLKLTQGSTVVVGIFVWLIDEPKGLYTGRLADTTATQLPGYGSALVQPAQLGIDLYVKMMRDRGGVLPLPSGINVTMEFVYINLAGGRYPASYAAEDLGAAGYPKFMVADSYPLTHETADVWQNSAAFPGDADAGIEPGLFYQATSQNLTVLKEKFGIDQPFTFLTTAILTLEESIAALGNLVEDKLSHVIVVPFLSSDETLICSDVPGRTPDCDTRTSGIRLPGSRRFETMFSTLTDSIPSQSAALESFHTLGVKTVVIINTIGPASYTRVAAEYTAEAAELLNLRVVARFQFVEATCDYYGKGGVARNCPPPLLRGANHSQFQVFPNNETAFDVAAFLAANDVDALILIGEPSSPGAWTLANLFDGMRAFDYTPKVISCAGSVQLVIAMHLSNPHDLFGVWTDKPWDPRLVGSNYRNELTPTQFELLPASNGIYGPQKFQNAYDAEYGPTARWGAGGTLGANPHYRPALNDPSMPILGWGALMQIQKLIEFSGTTDVATILASAAKVSAPSAYQPVKFDRYGRTAFVNQVLVQGTTDGKQLLLSPYNIGVPPIYPLPTWSERVFDPQRYSARGEKVLVSVTAGCILLCIALVAFVVRNWRSAVIRAATPSFCLVIIFGAILMLTSNFFATLVVNGAHCAASVWLLTTGFTCVFASLFIKTFRIWRIFHAHLLQPVKLRDRDLLLALSVFLLVDVLINAAWHGAVGMHAERVYLDPLRPSYDYFDCQFNAARGPIYAHLIIKGTMLLIGIMLTWAVRHVPSQFNESTLIALSIYNTSFVVCFIVPIIAVGLGGRNTTYLIRGFAVIFVAMSTLGLLFVPKLWTLCRVRRRRVAPFVGVPLHLQFRLETGKTRDDQQHSALGGHMGLDSMAKRHNGIGNGNGNGGRGSLVGLRSGRGLSLLPILQSHVDEDELTGSRGAPDERAARNIQPDPAVADAELGAGGGFAPRDDAWNQRTSEHKQDGLHGLPPPAWMTPDDAAAADEGVGDVRITLSPVAAADADAAGAAGVSSGVSSPLPPSGLSPASGLSAAGPVAQFPSPSVSTLLTPAPSLRMDEASGSR